MGTTTGSSARSSLYQQNAILQGASGLMRHRRSSARERAAQQAGSFRPASGGYGYGSYGNFGGQQQPSIWGHQPPRGSSGYQPRGGAAGRRPRRGRAVAVAVSEAAGRAAPRTLRTSMSNIHPVGDLHWGGPAPGRVMNWAACGGSDNVRLWGACGWVGA